MIAHPSSQTSSRFEDVLVVVAMAVLVAGMCLALAWVAPFELLPPRIR